MKDGGESDVDCGGTCATKCAVNKQCNGNADCVSGSCITGICTAATGTPKWLVLKAMPMVRTELAVGWATTTQIYVVGGLDSAGNSTDQLDVYTPSTNTWTTMAGAGVPFAGMAGSGVGGSLMWAFGGYDTDMYLTGTYNLQFLGATNKAAMPTDRANAAAVYSWSDYHHYVLGGDHYAANQACINTVEGYSTANNTWVTGPSLNSGRCGPGAASDKASGRIYVFGGEGHFEMHDIVGTIESWKSGESSWTVGPVMPQARSYVAGAMGGDGRAYAIGGENGSFGASGYVHAYNPVTGRWDTVATLNAARTRAAATVGPDGRIYVFGGQIPPGGPGPAEALDSVEAYGPLFTLSPTHAQAGATVTLTGSNFAANAQVSVYLDYNDITVIKSATSNASGAVSMSFTVPSTYVGGHIFKAVDDKSQYAVTQGFVTDP
jgi:N-acetylneuraminic acid mutarotase